MKEWIAKNEDTILVAAFMIPIGIGMAAVGAFLVGW